MPTKLTRYKHYNLVDETYDTRIPLHNEDAFKHGINFKAKFIGSMDVQKPAARTEIVVAMRNIRYQFKVKQIEKRKVLVSVSLNGVKVELRKKKKKKNQWGWDEEHTFLMHDPVYRIFYVSHDSHDLKIWSYIARDGNSSRFRCHVFKASRKKQAMHIVRTIGQAFEVSHKYNPQPNESKKSEAKILHGNNEENEPEEVKETDIDAVDIDINELNSTPRKGVTDLDFAQKISESHEASPLIDNTLQNEITQDSSNHQVRLMRQEVTQAEMEAEVTAAEIKLLKEQLSSEKSARIEAQARNHQLLVQNRELISQMSEMITRLKEVEEQSADINSSKRIRFLSRVDVEASPLIIKAPISEALSLSLDQEKEKNSFHNNDATSRVNNGTTNPFLLPSSVVQNKHIDEIKTNQSNNEKDFISSLFLNETTTSESTDELISSSSSSSSGNGTVKRASTSDVITNSSKLHDTVDTSIWTSGIGSPSRDTLHVKSDDSIFDEVTSVFSTTDLLTQKPSGDRGNGFVLSPIDSINKENNHSTKQKNINLSPIKWRAVSPPQLVSERNAVDIPRIDPPPRVEKSRIFAVQDHKFQQTPTSSILSTGDFTPPNRFVEADDCNLSSLTSVSTPHIIDRTSSSSKYFDVSLDEYQRRLRYEPINKLQASQNSKIIRRTFAGEQESSKYGANQVLKLPQPLNDDIDSTVGSILDQVDTSTDQFSVDFWEPNITTAKNETTCHADKLDHISPLDKLS